MRAQSSAEFIIVVLFFLIVITTILMSYYSLVPSEVSKTQEQRACSRAELLANALLNYPGNDTNWETSGVLTRFGLSTGNFSEISYDKWLNATARGIFNISNSTNQTEPFYLEYQIYALKTANSDEVPPPPSGFSPRVNLVRADGSLTVLSGSNSTVVSVKIKLFFPFTKITSSSGCFGGVLEPEDSNTTTERDGGSEVELNFINTAGDFDCIDLIFSTTPDIIFIKDVEVKNTTLNKEYLAYVGNHTLIKSSFGGSIVDPTKKYCSLERAAILNQNYTLSDGFTGVVERFPIKIKIMSW